MELPPVRLVLGGTFLQGLDGDPFRPRARTAARARRLTLRAQRGRDSTAKKKRGMRRRWRKKEEEAAAAEEEEEEEEEDRFSLISVSEGSFRALGPSDIGPG